jgi:hypothetical protein
MKENYSDSSKGSHIVQVQVLPIVQTKYEVEGLVCRIN